MSAGHPSDDIIAWAQKQPKWRQDALRRVLQGAFTSKDEDEVLSILKHEYDALEAAPAPDPITKDHLPLRGQHPNSLKLLSIDQVSNVNRLIEGAELSFSSDGMTVIYGDNGSGKSGFVRIVKKACRSRATERILPNVFDKKRNLVDKVHAVAAARFRLADGDSVPEVITWSDDEKTVSNKLARLAIFDSKTASVHVDGENRVTVVPHNIDCFEKLAQISDRLRDRLKSEVDDLKRQLAGALPSVDQNTLAGALLAKLSNATKSDVEKVCVWNPSDDERIAAISSLVKDPLAEANRLGRILTAMNVHLAALTTAETALSHNNLNTLAALRTAAQTARAAASMAASDAFNGEPLAGVGGDPWRILFEAAKKYSLERAYPGEKFPVTRENSHCVLCQQELSDSAKLRFQRFADFINGVANEKAAVAEANRDAAVLAINPQTFAIPEPLKELEDHLILVNIRDALSDYRKVLVSRRSDAIRGIETSALPESPLPTLRREITKVETRIATALASTDPSALGSLKSEHLELEARKAVTDCKDELIRRIELYRRIELLDKCIKNCATKGVSDQGTKMLRSHVTDTLIEALNVEKRALGIESIPLSLSERTEKAVVQHKLRLDGATLGADTSQILSEGEHRAVALAAFLSELAVYPSCDPIVVDDPISSLDQSRRSKVAERLVNEAQKRQVIVFTHDLAFLFETRFFADKVNVPIRVLGIRRGAFGYGALDPDGDPWQAKSIGGRRQWLIEQLANLKRLKAEMSHEYEAQAKFYFARLRETWERLIEEKVFANVVGRFQPGVQTQRLDEAVIDDEIVRSVYYGMTAASTYTGHDTAMARGPGSPTVEEAQKELDALSDCIRDVDQKSKAAKATRKDKVNPSKSKPAVSSPTTPR
jgi:ABC-type lipoprotein export system ATPase subunit